VNGESYILPEQAEVCPTCGQAIPREHIDEAIEKATKAYNLDKAKRLESISTEGKEAAVGLKIKQQELEKLEAELRNIRTDYETAKVKFDTAVMNIENTKANFTAIENTEEYQREYGQWNRLNGEIVQLKSGNQDQLKSLYVAITDIDTQIRTLQAELAKKEQSERATSRIEELKVEEKKLAKEYERLEGELFLTEQFIRTKVQLLTDKINSKFKMARFKLFNQQINGGLLECCETT
jgi:hypothetical protein